MQVTIHVSIKYLVKLILIFFCLELGAPALGGVLDFAHPITTPLFDIILNYWSVHSCSGCTTLNFTDLARTTTESRPAGYIFCFCFLF